MNDLGMYSFKTIKNKDEITETKKETRGAKTKIRSTADENIASTIVTIGGNARKTHSNTYDFLSV